MPRDTGARVGAAAARACLPLALLLALGCSRTPQSDAPRAAARPADSPLTVNVYADTGRGGRLEVHPPTARVWLESVTPARLPPPEPALPEAPPDSQSPPEQAAPGLATNPGLQPPVLREPGALTLPPGWRGVRTSVDLDVRVDEAGRVSDVLLAPAGGDSAAIGGGLVEAARRCALAMRFYPALRGGRPVAVWCRQRFDFTGARR